MYSINPQTDTLWKVAYGREPSLFEKKDNHFPEEIFNLAADHILKDDKISVVLAKTSVACGTVILAIGLILAFVYTLSPSHAVSSFAVRAITCGVLLTGLGTVFFGLGAYFWYHHAKRLEEDKTKPLVEIIDRLGEDLAEIQNRNRKFEDGNAFKHAELMSDAQKLLEVLKPYAKKA